MESIQTAWLRVRWRFADAYGLLLGQAESYTLGDIVEPVVPGIGLGVIDKRVGEAGFAVLIAKDESQLVLLGRGEPDRFRGCSAVDIHPHAGVLLGLLLQPMNTVASYCGSPWSFFSRETSRNCR